jgi:hypothetical protein
MSLEDFVLRSGVYLNTVKGWFWDMGRLRGIAPLWDKPVVLDIPLNRYARFTKPGQYVLKVSGRKKRRNRLAAI